MALLSRLRSARLRGPTESAAQLVDINILPERQRAKRRGFAFEFDIWRFVVAGLGIVLVPLILYLLFVTRQIQQLETDLETAQARLESERQSSQAQVAEAQSAVDSTRSQAQAVRDRYFSTVGLKKNWEVLAPTLMNSAPPGVEIDSLIQTSLAITLQGWAPSQTDAVSYVENLQRSGLFENVTLQSLIAVNPQVSAPPEAQPTPAEGEPTPTPAPTPSPRAAGGFDIVIQLSLVEPAA